MYRKDTVAFITGPPPLSLSSYALSLANSSYQMAKSHSDPSSRPEKSAFGKAAIGKDKKSAIMKSRNTKITTPIGSKGTNRATIRTAMSTKEVIRRRDAALLALRTHINLSLESSIDILNSHPQLYTHLPDLSDKLLYLLNETNLKATQLRKMLETHPLLMEKVFMDSEENLTNTIEILQTELDLSIKDIKTIQSKALPAILSYPRSELKRRISVYKLDLEYPTEEIKNMVLKDPRMLRTDSRKVRQILQVFREELDIRKEDVHIMLNKESLLLTYNAEDNIRPTIQFLKNSEFGLCLGIVKRKGISTASVDTKEEKEEIIQSRLKSIIMAHPMILSCSLEQNLKPTVDFFVNELGLTKDEFGRVIYRRGGTLLAANLERNLRRKVEFLRSSLGLELDGGDGTGVFTDSDKKRLLAGMLATVPDILTLSIENNLQPKFDFFTQELGFSNVQVRHIMLKRPQLLALSLDRNLAPKIEFLTKERKHIKGFNVDTYSGGLGMPIDALRDWIVEYPQTLTFTLDTRIRTRVFDVVRLDLRVGYDLGQVPMNFVTRSERSWKSWIELR